MELKAEIGLISIAGRGHWLAAALAQSGVPVTLLDVSQQMGTWAPEDLEGPFGFFQTHGLEEERLNADIKSLEVQHGLTLWLAEGPIEFRGPVTEYRLSQAQVPKSVISYVQGSSKVNEVQAIPFQNSWLAHLSHALTEKTLGAHRVQKGDALIGIASSGFHSNGYSLLRKVFEADLEKWAETLLTPTALYVKFFKSLRGQADLHALAHITGGGIDNIPRVLPAELRWKKKDWAWPAQFREVQKRTGMSDEKMLTTLNCGIGLVVIVPADQTSIVKSKAQTWNFETYDLGVVE